MSNNEYQDITQHEIQALKFEYNLADAHTHQSQSPSQNKIVDSLPELWRDSERKKQAESEDLFIRTFFEAQRQSAALKTPTMLVYAASIAMVIIANYLMKKKLDVALIDPCFDNIHDILKHMDIPMETLKEEWLHDPDSVYENLKNNVKADALFIVDPNNPTGFTLTGSAKDPELTKKGFLEVFKYAKDHNKLLIFDFCFASFLLPGNELGIFEINKLLTQRAGQQVSAFFIIAFCKKIFLNYALIKLYYQIVLTHLSERGDFLCPNKSFENRRGQARQAYCLFTRQGRCFRWPIKELSSSIRRICSDCHSPEPPQRLNWKMDWKVAFYKSSTIATISGGRRTGSAH